MPVVGSSTLVDWDHLPQSYKHTLSIGLLGLAWTSVELIAYVMIRPYFMQLLNANPKLAGQQKKKERTASLMQTRVVSFLHNVVQIPLACLILLDPVYSKSPIFAHTDLSTIFMTISAGYFLYDIFECIVRQEGADFVVHGVCGFLACAIAVYSDCMHYFGAGFLLWELSTPFLHLHWVLQKVGKTDSTFYAINALAGMFAFFCSRIVWGNALTVILWWESHKALQTPQGATLPLAMIWFYRSATAIMTVMNAWWFSKMVRMLVAAVRAKPAGDAAAKAA